MDSRQFAVLFCMLPSAAEWRDNRDEFANCCRGGHRIGESLGRVAKS